MTNATSVRLAATALLLAPALVACGQNQQQQAAPPPPTKDQELLAEIRDLLKSR